MWINLLTNEQVALLPEPNRTEVRGLLQKYNRVMAIAWGCICTGGLIIIARDNGLVVALVVGLSLPFGLLIGCAWRKWNKRNQLEI